MRVLVIEDDTDILDAVAELLESEGDTVTRATNGREALERMREAASPPELILLDLKMPVMTGWEFRERQLADEELASVPLLLFTAHADAAAIARSLGASGVLRKPVRAADLLERVAEFRRRD